MTQELKNKIKELHVAARKEGEHGLAGIISAYQVCSAANAETELLTIVEPLIRKIAIAIKHPKFTEDEEE